MYLPNPKIRAASKVKIPRFGYNHVGIIEGIYDGVTYVIHNLKGRGIERTTLREFCDGDYDKLKVSSYDGPLTPKEVVGRARELLGSENYDLLSWNCEHFTNWVQYGVKKSPQLKLWGGIALLTGLIIANR